MSGLKLQLALPIINSMGWSAWGLGVVWVTVLAVLTLGSRNGWCTPVRAWWGLTGICGVDTRMLLRKISVIAADHKKNSGVPLSVLYGTSWVGPTNPLLMVSPTFLLLVGMLGVLVCLFQLGALLGGPQWIAAVRAYNFHFFLQQVVNQAFRWRRWLRRGGKSLLFIMPVLEACTFGLLAVLVDSGFLVVHLPEALALVMSGAYYTPRFLVGIGFGLCLAQIGVLYRELDAPQHSPVPYRRFLFIAGAVFGLVCFSILVWVANALPLL